MGNLKFVHLIAEDKDSGEPVGLVCDEHGYIRITLDTETVTVGGSALPTGAATSAKQDISKGILDNIEDGIDELKSGIALAAGSNVIGSAGIDPRITTPAVLGASSSGDNTVIAAPGAGKHLEIYRIVATVARRSEVDLVLKSGANALSGAMESDWYAIDFGGCPLICNTNEAFIINLSAAVNVRGFVQYVEVTE
jgi:hypothetical protein